MIGLDIILALLLAGGLVAGYFEWQAHVRRLAAAARDVVIAERAAADLARQVATLERDLDWERGAHAATALDRDMYATALRGKLSLDARREQAALSIHPSRRRFA